MFPGRATGTVECPKYLPEAVLRNWPSSTSVGREYSPVRTTPRLQIDSLYKRGARAGTFALVLEGSLTISAGTDGFISLATPWMPLAV